VVIKKRRTANAKALSAQLGARILSLCAERDWTQRGLAVEAELDPGYISRIIHGDVEPCLGTLATLARVFGLTLAEFFKGVTL
jgi:transcriptional regulator with XRE-family HTH domain